MSSTKHDLPTDSLPRLAYHYIGGTVFNTALMAFSILTFTLFTIAKLSAMGDVTYSYGLLAVLGMAVFFGQHRLMEGGTDSEEDASSGEDSEEDTDSEEKNFLQESVELIFVAFIFNMIVYFTAVMGVFVAASTAPVAGVLFAIFWPVWEFKTASYDRFPLPLSTLGLSLAILEALSRISRLAQHIADALDPSHLRLDIRLGELLARRKVR